MTADLFQDAMVTEIRKTTMIAARDGGGKHCPCCDQYVKVYSRTITSFMARQLIHAYRFFPDEYFHTREMVLGSASAGDWSKLSYWGLIEPKYHEEGYNGKKTSGLWRITHTGKRFACNAITLPKYAHVYNSNVLELDGEPVDIIDCLNNKFDYNELMERTP